jgi:hypothetical protein
MINTANFPPYHPVKGIPLESLPPLDGLRNTLNVTDLLRKYKRSFIISYDGDDCITLSCGILSYIFSIEIDEHQTKPIIYSGSEDVETDRAELMSLLSDMSTVLRRREPTPRIVELEKGAQHNTLLADIGDLLRFLRFLRKNDHRFFISQDRYNSIMVTITLEVSLIEVDFFEDHIEYSIFQKDGASDNDQQRMIDLLAWYKGDD